MLPTRVLEALAALLASVAALMSRRVRHDIVGVATLIALVALGLVTPSQAIGNFSSEAVIVLASTMVIAGIVAESGFLEVLGDRIASRISNGFAVIVVVLLVSLIGSGFVSDVALTLMFMPLIYSIASRSGKPAHRYLILLSYAAILGGRYTMIGTSSNIVLEGLWTQRFGRPLPLFSVTPVGLSAALAAIMVAALAVPQLVRGGGGGGKTLENAVRMSFMVEARVAKGSDLVGARPGDVSKRLGVRVRAVSPRLSFSITRRRGLREGDVLLLQVPSDRLPVLLSEKGLETDLGQGPFFQLLVTSDSPLVGSTVYEANMRLRNVRVVGVSAKGPIRSLRSYTISAGDVLLVRGEEKDVASSAEAFRLTPLAGAQPKSLTPVMAASGVAGLAIAIIASDMGVNMALSFLAGALAAALPNPRLLRRLYSFIDWPALVFVATYLSMGEALVSSGLSVAIARVVSSPLAFLLGGALLANLVGNVASAIILGPIAVSSQHPLLSVLALSMGASSTFITPFSHPANLLVQSAGGYTPSDFAKAGAVVTAVVILVAALYLHLI